MPQSYLVLDTIDQVAPALESPPWSLWARFSDRQDAPIRDLAAVQVRDGVLWANAGEWSPTLGYLNEEWLKPLFIYLKHMCDGCSYPPNMCCLQPSAFGSVQDVYGEYDHDYAQEIMESDEYLQAEALLGAFPKFPVEPRKIEA